MASDLDTDRPTSPVSRAVWPWRAGEAGSAPQQPVLGRLLRMLGLMAVFGALAWWRGHRIAACVLAGLAAANVLAAALAPGLFRAHARLWEKLGEAGLYVIGTVTLTLFYYLLVSPAALVLRLLGRRPLKLRFPGPEPSYWGEPEERPDSEAEYERQF